MSLSLFHCAGGTLVLPDRGRALVGRVDGGHLVVNPPRSVWDRSELSASELTAWGALVAAAGRAMLDALPQLDGGCINYWDAGNWAVNDAADPPGPKTGPSHRQVHLHLIGRSRAAADPSWQWGEAPRFPAFRDRDAWAATFERLTPPECVSIVTAAEARLRTRYGFDAMHITPWAPCPQCGYPQPR